MDGPVKRNFGSFIGLLLVSAVLSEPPVLNHHHSGGIQPQYNAPLSQYGAPAPAQSGGYIQTGIPGLQLRQAENIFQPKHAKPVGDGGQQSFFFSPKEKILYKITAIQLEGAPTVAPAYGAPSAPHSVYGVPSQSAPAVSYGAALIQSAPAHSYAAPSLPAPVALTAYGVPTSSYGAPLQGNIYHAPAQHYGAPGNGNQGNSDSQNRRPRARPRPKYNISFAIESFQGGDDDCEEDFDDQPEEFGENQNPYLSPAPITGYRKKRGSGGSGCNEANDGKRGKNPLRPLAGGYRAAKQQQPSPFGGYSNALQSGYGAPKSQYGAPASGRRPSNAYGLPSTPSGYYDEIEVAGPANAAPNSRRRGRGGRGGIISGSASGEI